MTLISNTPDRRVYRLNRLVADIRLRMGRSWRWRVLDGDRVVGSGEAFSLRTARERCEALMEGKKG